MNWTSGAQSLKTTTTRWHHYSLLQCKYSNEKFTYYGLAIEFSTKSNTTVRNIKYLIKYSSNFHLQTNQDILSPNNKNPFYELKYELKKFMWIINIPVLFMIGIMIIWNYIIKFLLKHIKIKLLNGMIVFTMMLLTGMEIIHFYVDVIIHKSFRM